jgi:hypothetical protein
VEKKDVMTLRKIAISGLHEIRGFEREKTVRLVTGMF